VTQVREAMIVAGGAGTRLRPLTRTTPKPLLPFCGAPFLAGVVRRLAAVGVERVMLIVGDDPAPFEILRGEAELVGVTLEAIPEPEPLDTAGGVRAACERTSGPFLVLNGDILTDVDLRGAIKAHTDSGADATLVLTRVEDTSTFGVAVRDAGRIVRFVEKPEPGSLPGHDTVNAGTYVLEPEAIARFPLGRLSFEREVFPDLLERGAHLEGWVGDGVWADLGTPDRFLAGHRLALDGRLRWPSLDEVEQVAPGWWQQQTAEVSPDARVEGPVLLGAGVRVAAGARVGPYAVLGAGTQVGEDVTVTDSVLFDHVRLARGCRAEAALIGHHARLGREVLAGPGVVIGDDWHVPDGERLAAGTRLPEDP
jgi:NDP-sugar pyrophosphorylase family protein